MWMRWSCRQPWFCCCCIQEQASRFRAVLSHLHGPREGCYDGIWHDAETWLWTQSSLESGCIVPALRDMKHFFSNPMKVHTFAIKAQLLHFEMYEAPGYLALGCKCPISRNFRAQDNGIECVSCSIWTQDFWNQQCVRALVCTVDLSMILQWWEILGVGVEKGMTTPNLKDIFLLLSYSVSGAFLSLFIWC